MLYSIICIFEPRPATTAVMTLSDYWGNCT